MSAGFPEGGCETAEGCLRFCQVDGHVQQQFPYRRYLLRLPDWRLGLGDVWNTQSRGLHNKIRTNFICNLALSATAVVQPGCLSAQFELMSICYMMFLPLRTNLLPELSLPAVVSDA